MAEVVYLYNYGEGIFKDEIHGKEIIIAPAEQLALPISYAKFLVGDWDLVNEGDRKEEANRVSFRKGGITPTLKVFMTIEQLEKYKKSLEKNSSINKEVVNLTAEKDSEDKTPASFKKKKE